MNASSEVVRDDHQEPDHERLKLAPIVSLWVHNALKNGHCGEQAIHRTLDAAMIETIIAAAPERARRADWAGVLANAV
jgi:hypothetical protein